MALLLLASYADGALAPRVILSTRIRCRPFALAFTFISILHLGSFSQVKARSTARLSNVATALGHGLSRRGELKPSHRSSYSVSSSKIDVPRGTAEICAQDLMDVLAGGEAAANLSYSRVNSLLTSIRPLVQLRTSQVTPLGRSGMPGWQMYGRAAVIRNSQLRQMQKTTFGPKARLYGSLLSLGHRKVTVPAGISLLRVNSVSAPSQRRAGVPVVRRWVEDLVHWPPPGMLQLAEVVAESGCGKEALRSFFTQQTFPVPDVEGAKANKCELTKYPAARRFLDESVNAYFGFLFEAIAELAPAVGLKLSLSRFDLFHAHLFCSEGRGQGAQLGALFHAREYPAMNNDTFPVNLGYCQRGSPVPFDDGMDLRNLLWLAPRPRMVAGGRAVNGWASPGSLCALDASEGTVIYDEMVAEGLEIVRTIYEGDFGDTVVDVNYLAALNCSLEEKIFLC